MFRYIFVFFLIFSFCNGQNLMKFEPPDGRIIHGLGQYVGFYYTDDEVWGFATQYQNAVKKIPVIYSVYLFLDPYISSIDSADLNNVIPSDDYPYILQVGLILMDSTILTGKINLYTQKILDGTLDQRLIKVAHQIKNTGVPVFFRPGFEFGVNNDGIQSDPDMTPVLFKNIWKHIYDLFEAQNVENVAWVWNTVNPDEFNYLEWYPGDAYVDWWGINYFTRSQINASDEFLADAVAHNKPVIVCESNPIQNGGTTNSDNWEKFFVPYFNKIKNELNIKAFVYVNSPWTNEPLLDWPDSRIYSNPVITENFRNELKDSAYIHMDEYLNNPELITSLSKKKPIPGSKHIEFTAYPNPFNSQTRFSWKSKTTHSVKIEIYSIVGEKITSINIDRVNIGINEFLWDAGNLPSGIYYAQILAEDINNKTGLKLILIK